MVWERLGRPSVYVEPFCGSCSVLFWNEDPIGREIVCDTDGGICNFLRAVRYDPDEVAWYADWPTVHDDLVARHAWLTKWVSAYGGRLREDANYFNVKAAGWWVWGIALHIGGGWCQPEHAGTEWDRGQIPYVSSKPGGKGVGAQRINRVLDVPTLATASDRRTRPDLVEWFRAIADRLHGVVILNRPWRSALTNTLIQNTATSPRSATLGVFMDPPYLTTERAKDLYHSDTLGESDRAAVESWQWAVEHGGEHRIAYCCHLGDFDPPEGWDLVAMPFKGIKDPARRAARQDCIMFSPACLERRQPLLWEPAV